MKKFQGVDVRSDFFPYLRKIWKMHDFFEDHAVRSNGLLTWALESLAKMMIILQNNMGKGKGKSPLNESQAEYLTSTLVDLQSMQFRLDWLVPIVEKALSRYKSKEPGDIVMELQVERYRLLGKLHQVEGKLADQKRVAAQSQCSVLWLWERKKEYASFMEKVTDAVIKTAFEQYGTATKVHFIPDYIEQHYIGKCFLVELENAKQAKSILEVLSSYPFMMSGMPQPVRGRPAQPEMFDNRPPKPDQKILRTSVLGGPERS
ncbi:hypothetical protein SOVF_145910 [Spinacia oleracea]|nr:hypothetical protein SOVF_145910 [Spinacia oleracea]